MKPQTDECLGGNKHFQLIYQVDRCSVFSWLIDRKKQTALLIKGRRWEARAMEALARYIQLFPCELCGIYKQYGA